MLRTPGFVLPLAALFWMFGHSLVAAKIFNLVCSVLTAWCVYALGHRVSNDRRVGALAAAATFFHPAVILADSRGGLESLLCLGIAGTLLLVYRAMRTDSLRDYVFAGLAFGAVLLIKSSAALFPPLLFLALWATQRTWQHFWHAFGRVFVFGIAAVALSVPWIWRNYEVSHAFVPTMTNGGLAAFQGVYVVKHWDSGREHYALIDEADAEQEAIAKQMGLRYRSGFFQTFYTPQDEITYYSRLGTLATEQYREDPGLLVRAVLFNLRGFWMQGRTARATQLNTIVVLPFLALVAAGCWVAWRRRLPVSVLLLFSAGFMAAHLPIIGVARYHVPVIPPLAIVLALAALPWLTRKDHRKP
jgi:4-amino-4-deoxy-L-arabinose transferase-like glycosyltransferase